MRPHTEFSANGVQPPSTMPPRARPITRPKEPGPAGDDRRTRPLTEREETAVAVVGAMVAALGLLGFVNSFTRVAAAARASFGWLAFTVPIGIDLGIAVFAALDIVLARLDMRLRWLRLIPWSLTGATVYLNVAGEASVFGIVAHATLPALWVVAVEVGAHIVRTRVGLANGTRMDSIRLSRWLLAPVATVRLWRRMVLWEVRSYVTALVRERERVLALTELKDAYGPLTWRWKAPRRTKALYRLGELSPITADGPPNGDTPRGKSARRTERGRSAGRTRARSRTRRRTVPDVEDLMPTGRRIAAVLDERGVPLTRDTLAAELREAGATAGNDRVGALLARLKTEPDHTEGAQQ